MTPSQFFDRNRSDPDSGLKRLMMAVLNNGIDCYLSNRDATTARRRNLYLEAKEWLESPAQGPFSFLGLCDTFNFESKGLRKAILAHHGPFPRRSPASVGRVNTPLTQPETTAEKLARRARIQRLEAVNRATPAQQREQRR